MGVWIWCNTYNLSNVHLKKHLLCKFINFLPNFVCPFFNLFLNTNNLYKHSSVFCIVVVQSMWKFGFTFMKMCNGNIIVNIRLQNFPIYFKLVFFFSKFMDQFLYSPSYMGRWGVKVKHISFMSNHNCLFSIILAH